ncbi:hypothetical protein Scel_04600 [Streptomyces cellostaticus]|nr:hypothetical protein Scel_04600 [Streptomyces cellostaticus]
MGECLLGLRRRAQPACRTHTVSNRAGPVSLVHPAPWGWNGLVRWGDMAKPRMPGRTHVLTATRAHGNYTPGKRR